MPVPPFTPGVEHSELFERVAVEVQDESSPPSPIMNEKEQVTGEQGFEGLSSISKDQRLTSVSLTGIDALAGIQPIRPTSTPSDEDIPDNYVTATIAKQKYLPPVTWKNLIWNIQWISFLAITITPCIALYGFFTTPLNRYTVIWR